MKIGERFNPGEFVEFYNGLLPKTTQDNTFFPRARKQGRGVHMRMMILLRRMVSKISLMKLAK